VSSEQAVAIPAPKAISSSPAVPPPPDSDALACNLQPGEGAIPARAVDHLLNTSPEVAQVNL